MNDFAHHNRSQDNESRADTEFELPDWVTSPRFLIAIAFFLVSAVPVMPKMVSNLFSSAVDPQSVKCFDGSDYLMGRAEKYTPGDRPLTKMSDNLKHWLGEKEIASDQLAAAIGNCPIGACEGEDYKAFHLKLSQYLRTKAQLTYKADYWHGDAGLSV